MRARHNRQLIEYHAGSLEIVRRSVLGLIPIYNLLPQEIVDANSVRLFQRALSNLVKHRALSGFSNWQATFSPRIPIISHPLYPRYNS